MINTPPPSSAKGKLSSSEILMFSLHSLLFILNPLTADKSDLQCSLMNVGNKPTQAALMFMSSVRPNVKSVLQAGA